MCNITEFPPWSECFSVLVWDPFPLVGLTLAWFIWSTKLALHITLKSVKSVEIYSATRPTFVKKRFPSLYFNITEDKKGVFYCTKFEKAWNAFIYK